MTPRAPAIALLPGPRGEPLRRLRRGLCSLLAVPSLWACATPLPAPKEPWQDVAEVSPDRAICGWEELGQETPLRVADGERAGPGWSTVALSPAASTPYGEVQQALKPAEDSLVRIKLVVDDRWLLSTTYPQRQRQPPKPPPGERSTRIVGQRQITRSTRRPAERFADLRVDGARVLLFVENEAQSGRDLQISALGAVLAELSPPAQVFAVTATAATPWTAVLEVAVAAACYDREPGDEPHEVVLD